MKKLTTAKIWQFAAGQFGWALLSGIISNWLVYFYQPDETAISQGQTVFIPQGLVIFGILPQAVVADIAQSDAVTSGSSREGMFYAARTFAFKLGQSLSMLIFTAVSTIGNGSGAGYRIAAFGAAVFCGAGGLILMFYDEKKINCVINGKA